MQDKTAEVRGGDGIEEALARVDPDQIVEAVSEFARENPHTALVAALGVGYLLGGGLTPRLMGAIGLFAARHYFGETLRDALQRGAELDEPGA